MEKLINKEYRIEYKVTNIWECEIDENVSFEQWVEDKKKGYDVVMETDPIMEEYDFQVFTEIKINTKSNNDIKKIIVFSFYPMDDLVIDQNFLICVLDGYIYKIDLETLDYINANIEADLGAKINFIRDGYLITDNGMVYCLSKELRQKWSYSINDEIKEVDIDYFNDIIIISDFENNIFRIDFKGNEMK